MGVVTAEDGVAVSAIVLVACSLAANAPDSPTGSIALLKLNFTVPPAPVRFNWHLTGCGSDSVPSLQ